MRGAVLQWHPATVAIVETSTRAAAAAACALVRTQGYSSDRAHGCCATPLVVPKRPRTLRDGLVRTGKLASHRDDERELSQCVVVGATVPRTRCSVSCPLPAGRKSISRIEHVVVCIERAVSQNIRVLQRRVNGECHERRCSARRTECRVAKSSRANSNLLGDIAMYSAMTDQVVCLAFAVVHLPLTDPMALFSLNTDC